MPTEVQQVDYDHKDEQAHLDPWPRWKRFRDLGPVQHTDNYGGFYMLMGYAEITAAVRDTDTYSSTDGTGIPPIPMRMPPLDYDPPEARRWRELVNPFFAPGKVQEYRPWLARLAQERVATAMAGDRVDVSQDIGIPLTREVILTIMGITNAPAELNAWTDDLIFGLNEVSARGGEQLWAFLQREVTDRREHPGGTDVVSELTRSGFRGSDQLLADEEIVSLLFLVLIAALETTNGAISAMVQHLVEHPEAAQRLREQPAIWPRAMDEFVRWSSPAVGLARTTRTDATVAGCPIPAQEKVMFVYASGNRDEREFDRPDEVVLDRHPNRHLGFGMGPHRCLGSHLAKAQMEESLAALLPLLPAWELDADNPPKWHAGSTRGMASLQLRRR
jgi:cytochrome P450